MGARRSLVVTIVWLAVAACRFDGRGGADGPAGADGPPVGGDARVDGPPGVFDIAHITVEDEATISREGDVVWSGGVTVNTTALTTTDPLPVGAALRAITQEVGGTEVVVLSAHTLMSSATVRVVGSRPLIIVADVITLSGVVDASASDGARAAGALISGPGVGAIGTHAGTFADGGGGGGGGATPGGVGGAATENTSIGAGGGGGEAYGDPQLSVLQGGSPGGAGLPACTGSAVGGDGGGAIQLSATTSIEISATIDVGGMGGDGGTLCTGNMGSGAGGGSGGAVYIQAPVVTGTGLLAANGGGGGSGSNWAGGPGSDGNPGQAGHLDGSVALGGPAVLPDGARGGDGGTVAAPGMGDPVASVYPNGGGGGGAPGRIYLDVPPRLSITLQASPTYVRR